MNFILSMVAPIALLAIGFVAPLQAIIWFRDFKRRGRRSPLTSKLLRGPGSTLRHELNDVLLDHAVYVGMLLFFPAFVFAVHLSLSYIGNQPETLFRALMNCILAVGGTGYCSWKLHDLGNRRYQLQCALEAETAVAQELDQLMRHGAIAFHDFPGEEFNIDHVVVTRGGVFAVETKSRLKPDRGGGAEDAKVVLEEGSLAFPGWKDATMLDQARRQAKWLSRWLTSAVGTKIEAKPVLALPGWFVDRRSKSDVRVISGREAKSLLSGWRGEPLSDELMTRIAHQVEQRCRDVEPTRYGRANKLGREKRAA